MVERIGFSNWFWNCCCRRRLGYEYENWKFKL